VSHIPSDDTRFAHSSLLNAIPDAVVIVDDGGRIAEVNVRTESLFGYRREELIGEPVEKLIPERFHASHVTDREAYRDAPHVRPMGVGRQLKAQHKDGHEFTVEISLAPFQTSDGPRVVGTIRDVSARAAPPNSD
jgi:PAS domain S-box-containing protein